jgi:hypothetical protein
VSLSAVVDLFCGMLVDSAQPTTVAIIIARLLQFALKQVLQAMRINPSPAHGNSPHPAFAHKYRALLQRMLAAHVSRIRSLADVVPVILRLVRGNGRMEGRPGGGGGFATLHLALGLEPCGRCGGVCCATPRRW